MVDISLSDHSNDAPLPGGYTLHPVTPEELDSVLYLRIAQNQADYQMDGLTAGELYKSWQEPAFHIGLDHWLVRAPQGQAVAYGEVRGNDSGTDFDVIFAIDPAIWQDTESGLSVALGLLERIDRRAADIASPRSYRLSSRVSTRNMDGVRLIESYGFTRSLTFHIMDADLSQPPAAPTLPDGVTIRDFIPGQDEQAVYRADEESGEDKGYHQPLSYADWCKRVGRYTPLFDPGLWFLAFVDGELAGTALNFYHDASKTAWVDHLGVRRAFRKRGIGMALLLHTLNVFRRRGYPLARLSVDSHSLTHAPRLYEQAGFRTVLGYHIYKK
jgi:GNAT superfamily N-acetyltransferase